MSKLMFLPRILWIINNLKTNDKSFSASSFLKYWNSFHVDGKLNLF